MIIAKNSPTFKPWKEIPVSLIANKESSLVVLWENEKIEIKIPASAEQYTFFFENETYEAAFTACKRWIATQRT